MMVDSIENTSFCGLWCNDCIPSNERLYQLTAELSELLEKLGFENYAAYKAEKVPEFSNYQTFLDVLNAFEKVHCYNKCHNGPKSIAGCSSSCKIRVCVLNKNLNGCWECDHFTNCEYILDMETLHPDIRKNLLFLQEKGIGEWSSFRGKHYNWTE